VSALPEQYLGKGDFLFRYHGEDIPAHGVLDGDVLIVSNASTAEPGALVVALENKRAVLGEYEVGEKIE
jgi:SOS-response transcriptional repressor LexA